MKAGTIVSNRLTVWRLAKLKTWWVYRWVSVLDLAYSKLFLIFFEGKGVVTFPLRESVEQAATMAWLWGTVVHINMQTWNLATRIRFNFFFGTLFALEKLNRVESTENRQVHKNIPTWHICKLKRKSQLTKPCLSLPKVPTFSCQHFPSNGWERPKGAQRSTKEAKEITQPIPIFFTRFQKD